MAWRSVIISKPSKISLNNHNFLYSPIDGKDIVVPIVDISVIILETHQVTITSALLSRMAEENILIFSCDKKHTPNGIFTPFHQHSRFSLMVHLQIKWSEPFKKRVWQQIIQQKIANQASVLKQLDKTKEYKELLNIQKRVKSGDIENLEAQAAKLYFNYLFNNFMRRDVSDWRNSALNYGYSIIRGVIARDLSASGLIPAIGIHHKNQLNSFNLADDLIEPFRAFVDLEVDKIQKENNIPKIHELHFNHKIKLVELLQKTVYINDEKSTLLNSSSIVINSLVGATKDNEFKSLKLPRFDNEE
ncbi:type II CRISPR-associated endonuclease Cas1 [Malaciobacter halophilus]|nr:type II CRISPR-associated endonuclease Cas1 [Malaciobacter halophilus]RYA24296.1 type II CRISPR-associated endonuclease Cas1 [Malaciobacter halophilus]